MAWFKLIASVIVIAMNGMHDVCMYVVEHFVLPPNDGHLVENKFFFFFFAQAYCLDVLGVSTIHTGTILWAFWKPGKKLCVLACCAM